MEHYFSCKIALDLILRMCLSYLMTESEQSTLAVTLKLFFYLKMCVSLPFLQIPGRRIYVILIIVIVKRKMTDR